MAIWTSAPISAAMTAARRLVSTDVLEHVLAVARAELEPAEQLDDLGRQTRDAGLVGGRLAGLAHDDVDLGARLGDDLLDAAGVDAAVGDELRDGDPGDLAPDRVEAAKDHGLGRVVDDQVDAGGLLEGADVAALAADDPALHLVGWQVDHRDGVLGGVVGGHALHRGQHDVASLVLGLLAGGALDGASELDGVVLGLGADGLEQHRLGVLGGQTRYALERDDLLLSGASEVLLGLVELALALEELAVALPRASRLRWSSCSSRWTRRRSCAASSLRRARASSSASRPQPELLVLRLEDQLLLAGAGLGLDAAGFGLRRLHPL